MNQNQQEKIQKLINTSPLLSAVERVEWKALLELMNDKQLGELEKILAGQNDSKPGLPFRAVSVPAKPQPQAAAHTSPAFPPVGSGVNFSMGGNVVKPPMPPMAPQPKPVSFPVASAVKSQPPAPFRHIMNLPNEKKENVLPNGAAKVPAITSPMEPGAVSKSPINRATTQAAGGNSGFAQKIKQALSQKDLPSDKSAHELDLPAPQQAHAPVRLPTVVAQVVSQPPIPKPPVVPAPAPKPPVVPIPAAKAPAMQPPVVRKPEPNKIVLPAGLKIDQISGMHKKSVVTASVLPSPEKNSAAPDFTLVVNVNQPEAPSVQPVKIAQVQQAPAPSQPQSESGMRFAKFTSVGDIAASTVTNLEQPLESSQTRLRPGSIVIDSLESVGSLTVQDFNSGGGAGLVKALKSLMASKGFFDVMVSLEQSPLYKIYLATGMKIMSGEKSFNDLSGPQYLDKDFFEEFTDVLREIRAGS